MPLTPFPRPRTERELFALGALFYRFCELSWVTYKIKLVLCIRSVASDTSTEKKSVPSAESSRSVRGLGKGVSGKPYPRLCNARRPRLEPRTFRSQAVRLYHLHQFRPSLCPGCTETFCAPQHIWHEHTGCCLLSQY